MSSRSLSPSRRALLGGGATALLLGTGAAGAKAAEVGNPDSKLIRLCSDYIDALTAYDCDGGYLECEDDPLWHAIEVIEQQLNGLGARTVAGVIAKAQVALHKAKQPNGSVNFSDSFTGYWPEQVVSDLLRIHEMQKAGR